MRSRGVDGAVLPLLLIALSPHHPLTRCADAYVAMYAVDALRQLAGRLLDRAELARFTHQGEALRPFAAVLRHSGALVQLLVRVCFCSA